MNTHIYSYYKYSTHTYIYIYIHENIHLYIDRRTNCQAASARHRCAARSEALATSLRSKLTELEAFPSLAAFRVAERGGGGWEKPGKMVSLQ